MNFYKKLRETLDIEKPRFVGEVIDYEDGVATVQTPGGGQVKVFGEASIGENVFFRDSVIEGPAPSLALEIIDVDTE